MHFIIEKTKATQMKLHYKLYYWWHMPLHTYNQKFKLAHQFVLHKLHSTAITYARCNDEIGDCVWLISIIP